MPGNFNILSISIITFCMISVNGCRQSASLPLPVPEPDLVIYTPQAEEIYAPLIKEFTERTGLTIQVKTDTSDALFSQLYIEKENPQCDIMFGAGTDSLAAAGDLWQSYESPDAIHISEPFRSRDYSFTTFSVLPFVIMYNTNVVTYRELPAGWSSLLEPRWLGRIAFVDPASSDIHAFALAAAVQACPDIPDYLERFAQNLDYETLEHIEDVNTGISSGRYSLGVTLEESAQALLNSGADISYIYPEEGTVAILDGTAIVKNCPHLENARRFLDFTISIDTQRILVSSFNRRSSRDDITPPAGLLPMRQIPIVFPDYSRLPGEQNRIQEQWAELLKKQTRKEGVKN